MFIALDTQWQHAGMDGVPVGLRYEAIRPTAGMMGIRMTAGMFEDLRAMEAAVLEIYAARAAEATKVRARNNGRGRRRA